MNTYTITLLLILTIIIYAVLTYRQLRFQHKHLHDLKYDIKSKFDNDEKTDYLRRKYNKTARAYNNKIGTFLGKRIAKKLNYVEVEMIEKKL